MKKLFTTLALALGLVLGSIAVSMPASAAASCSPADPAGCPPVPPSCSPTDPACPPVPDPVDCTDPIRSTDPICGRVQMLTTELVQSDQTANDYRAQVIALTAKLERVQRVADRRAATIQRLRAVIRSLR